MSSSKNPSGPQFPKAQIPLAPETEQLHLQDQIARLTEELAELRAIKEFADGKIKALTILAAHQGNGLWILSQKLRAMKMAEDEDCREQIEKEVNAILTKSDDAVVKLRGDFPSLEVLVSQSEDTGDYASTAALGEWIEQRDHIQKSEEESLRHQNNA